MFQGHIELRESMARRDILDGSAGRAGGGGRGGPSWSARAAVQITPISVIMPNARRRAPSRREKGNPSLRIAPTSISARRARALAFLLPALLAAAPAASRAAGAPATA